MSATLILVEGTDGTGKSRFINCLSQQLLELGSDIRTLAFPSEPIPIRARTHLSSEILFFLDDFNTTFHDLKCFSDDFVICDRSFLTTLTYQGFRGDYSLVKGRFYDSILTIGENTFFGHVNFDTVHTVLLTCSEKTAQDRIGQRASDKDELDKMTGHQQKMRLKTLGSRYKIVISDLKTKWNHTNPFRPDPVENTKPHFHEISTETETSESLAEAFIDLAIGD